jgi:two-component system, chemotaxis family, CheB/CheR fusion protein
MESTTAGLDHVVAIGASAGGLEALQELVAQLLPGGNVAYLVAQHLAPDHPSQLAELLARSTRLPVVVASTGRALAPGQIVVVPPNSDATVEASRLQLQKPGPRFGPSPSLDLLFDSLAGHWGPRAVAVVLSGTGSDGARGLRAVGAAGGLTLVQAPESARFDGMPRAAIALGGADLVADAATLGSRLSAWFSQQGSWLSGDAAATEPLLLTSVAAQLKQGTGIDFSQYKESTLRRQLQRRMAICGVSSLEDYLPLLAANAGEAQALVQNLLVTVTSFFRDPDAFSALAAHLKPLIARCPAGEKLRIWIPGCATGEEAYSIGMTVSEAMGHPADLHQRLKIFATDLDEQSLAIGRRGIYPITAAPLIPEALRRRFTSTTDHELEISKDLRSCIIFARHNVGEDPPFPNIDLISCRNTLIYFTAPLQERVLDLFSFSLLPGSLLFLGSSESLGRASGFTVLNPVHRIYERSSEGRSRSRITLAMPMQRVLPAKRAPSGNAVVHDMVPQQHVTVLEALVRTLGHPCLVLDENHDLVEVIGDVSPYCQIPEGRMTASAAAFLRTELQAEARALFLLVRADGTAASSRSLQLQGMASALRLQAAPLPLGERTLTVLSFLEESGEGVAPRSALGSSERDGDRDAAFAREIERLERELLSSQDTLRRSMADLEQANEELEASSEELQASSEELQSSNEELEASNEELQATNEELGTLNQQLRTRSDELERLNTDLENIQNSLSQGMVIVDRNLRITRFSPLAVRVFGLVDSDIGQPLIGVPTTVPLPELREALLAVLDGAERRSIEASSEEVSYLAQVMPYRNREGLRLGAIITLTDVGELVALRRAAEASLREFTSLADALDQAVWKRDHTMGRLLYMSRRIEKLTGWSPSQLVENPELFDTAIHPADRPGVAAARHAKGSGWTVTYRLIGRDGQIRALQEVATVVDESNDHYIVGTLTDVTSERLLGQRTRLLASGFERVVAAEAGPALALLDGSGQIVAASGRFAAVLGLPADGLEGHRLEQLAALLELVPATATEPAQAQAQAQAQAGNLIELAQGLLQHAPTQTRLRLQTRLAQAPHTGLQLELTPLSAGEVVMGLLLQLQLPADPEGPATAGGCNAAPTGREG